jgi:DNA-binding transcriptional ArsR family regulator
VERDVEAIIRAMRDPIRSKVYFALADRPGGATVRHLSLWVAETRRRVRYQLDVLVDDGLVAVTEGARRRGVVERIFQAVHPPLLTDEEVEATSEDDLRKITLQCFRYAIAEATSAAAAGSFWRPGYMQARVQAEVDVEGWSELAEIQRRGVEEIDAAVERSRQRTKVSGETLIHAAASLWLFEMPGWPE